MRPLSFAPMDISMSSCSAPLAFDERRAEIMRALQSANIRLVKEFSEKIRDPIPRQRHLSLSRSLRRFDILRWKNRRMSRLRKWKSAVCVSDINRERKRFVVRPRRQTFVNLRSEGISCGG